MARVVFKYVLYCTDLIFKEKTSAGFLLAKGFAIEAPQQPALAFFTVTNKGLLHKSLPFSFCALNHRSLRKIK